MVVRNLRRFAVPELAHEFPLCSRLMSDFERPELLYLAGAVSRHRQGPRRRPFAPRQNGCARFCREHAIGEADSRAGAWLVESHLAMSRDRAKAGFIRSRCRQRIRSESRRRAAPRRAVPVDRGGHTRHEPEGVERVESQAARGSVLRHAAPDSAATRTRFDSTHSAPAGRGKAKLRLYAISGRRTPTISGRSSISLIFCAMTAEEIAWHTRLLNYRVEPRRRSSKRVCRPPAKDYR